MKKKLLVSYFFIVVLLPLLMNAQAPAVQWNKLIGGTSDEITKAVVQTSDGGYLVAGDSYSSASGTISATNHGFNDYWITKLNAAGIQQWSKLFGGTGNEFAYDMKQIRDGGYIIVGSSNSSADGDVTRQNHSINSGNDMWILKLDASGNKQWDKLLGGQSSEGYETSIQQTTDGGYIIAGNSSSSQTGDVTDTNHGNGDYWIVRLDESGNKLWDKLYGGNGLEYAFSLVQTTDGGYIVAGYSASSQNGDVSGINHGGFDTWILKLAANGDKQWDKLLGGSSSEGDETAIIQTSDGGYAFATASSSSQSGDVTDATRGSSDYWLVKLDAGGNKLWDKLLGGPGTEICFALQQTTDGGYIITGESTGSSKSGDVSGDNHSDIDTDVWTVKTDNAGNKKWDRLLGGTYTDRSYDIKQTTDGGFILTGLSNSDRTGDVTDANILGIDGWVVKLAPDPSAGALPIALLSFTARQQNNNVLLNWSTASEQNSKDFIIQRSIDGISWNSIGTVTASGNSHTVIQYNFLDANPASNNIYRLLQRDFDNRSAISDTRIVNLTSVSTSGFRLLGNPVSNGSLLLELKTNGIVSIVNIQGVQVFKKQIAAGRQTIALDNYARGTYTIKMGADSKLFIVQ